VRYGGIEGGQHEVADAQQAEARNGRRGILGTEHEQKDLDYVMVALEVVQGGVVADGLDDDV
jgi:hypothetical protein